MVTSPFPFALLSDWLSRGGERLSIPPWLVDEIQNRVVLFLNHVLMQEPEARERLKRIQGQAVRVQWRGLHLQLAPSAAGLLERVPDATPTLRLMVADESPWALAQGALRGQTPPVRIDGDVQTASEISWLIDHVRWDAEEDLARLIGDALAHSMASVGRQLLQGLRQFPGAPGHPSRQGGA
jgi:ubiquinone biosynthesis accessory factor UbiJ